MARRDAVVEDAAEAYPGLAAVLERVRAGMGSDTATLLLVDRTRTILEPAATVGLDRTLRGARQVPIGRGFAGRVAQSRQPVVLQDVSPANVINPVLFDHGVRALLGVPVIEGSELLGVLHVGFQREHEFSDADTRRLTEFARELAAFLQERISRAEQTAALTLQRSLLPTGLKAPAGITMAARYVPASGDLGGDWYDAFQLPTDPPRLAIVMGDVAGHGLEAATIMGRMRSALRAYALFNEDPAEVLRRLDREVCHFEPDAMATVVFGVADEPYDTWRFSSAGHYPPLVGGEGEPARQAEIEIDRLIGADPEAERHSTSIEVPQGGYLCLFTDGLVERRPTDGDGDDDLVAANIARVAEALVDFGDPEMGCIRVLTEVVGDADPEDDIAVLIAQRMTPGTAP